MAKLKDPDQETVAMALSTPSGYARVRLGLKLHPTQSAVLDAVFNMGLETVERRTVFRCGNEVGKTAIVATSAVLYSLEMLDANVVSTAGVFRQVCKQLVPNLHRFQHLYPLWTFNKAAITIGGIDRYMGVAAADQGTFQGFHSAPGHPLVMIIDESAAVDDDIIMAAEERCNPDYMLIMGSPLGPEGIFYKMETDRRSYYQHFKLPQTECLKSQGYWIDDETVKRRIAKLGKDHPMVLSSIFAEFAMNVEGALLKLKELENCLEALVEYDQRGKRHVFCDFGGGSAEHVIAVCQGNRCWIEEAWREQDLELSCLKFIEVFEKLEAEIKLKPSEVEGDADGYGSNLIARIAKLSDGKWDLARFHGGEKPRFDEDYKNLISEVWNEGCRKIREKEVIFGRNDGDPRDQELSEQLLSRKAAQDSKGKLWLESKADLAKRGIASPDRADSFLGALHPMHTGLLTKIFVPKMAPDEIGFAPAF